MWQDEAEETSETDGETAEVSGTVEETADSSRRSIWKLPKIRIQMQ